MTTKLPLQRPLSKIISDRVHAKHKRERAQQRLISDSEIDYQTILHKLTGQIDTPSFRNFERCGKEVIYRICRNCESSEGFYYQCSLKWCPNCQWKITKRRSELLKRWIPLVAHPKHLVLTQRNFEVLTKKKLREHQKHLAKLRRTKVFKRVKGGCLSIEVTNEGRGWHLHSHWLVNADYVDMAELSKTWGKLVGQEFGIVHYVPVTDESYATEITKYVVKPGQMASWPAEQINEFVQAIHGRRFFFAFGELFKMAKQIRMDIAADKPEQQPCTCGKCDFTFLTEADSILRDIRKQAKRA